MAAPLTAAMPQLTQLGVNARIDVEALDPTTGAAVDGVSVTVVDIWADIVNPPLAENVAAGMVVGPFMLVPGPQE